MDYYGYTTDYDAAVGGILGGIAIILLIALAVGILQTIAFWKIFKKAGKGGWEAIIPFYSNWVLMEISGLNWWWFLLLFAPMLFSVFGLDWLGYIVNIFALFNCYFNLAKKFNKGTGFAICLTLFTPICASILGFSKDNVYNANAVVSNNGLFGPSATNSNVNNNNYQQPMNNNTMNNNVPQGQNTVNNNGMVQEFSFCGNCGTRLSKEARFCPNCGNQKL